MDPAVAKWKGASASEWPPPGRLFALAACGLWASGSRWPLGLFLWTRRRRGECGHRLSNGRRRVAHFAGGEWTLVTAPSLAASLLIWLLLFVDSAVMLRPGASNLVWSSPSRSFAGGATHMGIDSRLAAGSLVDLFGRDPQIS